MPRRDRNGPTKSARVTPKDRPRRGGVVIAANRWAQLRSVPPASPIVPGRTPQECFIHRPGQRR